MSSTRRLLGRGRKGGKLVFGVSASILRPQASHVQGGVRPEVFPYDSGPFTTCAENKSRFAPRLSPRLLYEKETEEHI